MKRAKSISGDIVLFTNLVLLSFIPNTIIYILGMIFVILIHRQLIKVDIDNKLELIQLLLTIACIEGFTIFTASLMSDIYFSNSTQTSLITNIGGCEGLYAGIALMTFIIFTNKLPREYYYKWSVLSSYAFVIWLGLTPIFGDFSFMKYLVAAIIFVFVLSMLINFCCEFKNRKRVN